MSDGPEYRPPLWLRNGHVNTVVGGLLRRIEVPSYGRERIETGDGDFLDLDWLRQGADRLAVLCHGLEGSSRRVYMSGMARHLAAEGWDILAWNYRGCSGEPNRTLRTYHSGSTDDLGGVVDHASPGYSVLTLVGFSLGGNMTLKYLGEQGTAAPVSASVVFSVPCDLAAGSRFLARPAAALYMARFMTSLKEKVREKDGRFPGQLDLAGLDSMRTFADFDDRFTAPLNGFTGAEDYWRRASSKPFIPAVRVPTLIASALDDPFLPEECFPAREVGDNRFVTLETPRWGGHVGFADRSGRYWSEARAARFLSEVLG